MTIEKQRSLVLLQLNKHLNEWNDTVALELKAKYLFYAKHRHEDNCLSLGETKAIVKGRFTEKAQLIVQHMREVHMLNDSSTKTRTAIGERHIMEKADLKQRFQEQDCSS